MDWQAAAIVEPFWDLSPKTRRPWPTATPWPILFKACLIQFSLAALILLVVWRWALPCVHPDFFGCKNQALPHDRTWFSTTVLFSTFFSPGRNGGATISEWQNLFGSRSMTEDKKKTTTLKSSKTKMWIVPSTAAVHTYSKNSFLAE